MNFKEDDLVYEIGTGKGHLTESLAKRTKKVISIEKDKYLTEKAKKKLKTYANVRVYHVDVLKYSFPNKDIQYRVFGNIPFNISTDIVRKVDFHSRAYQIDLIVEYGFALRLMDTSRLLGALLLPEVEVHILKKIPNYYFHPKPNVQCALVRWVRRSNRFSKKEIEEYKKFIEAWISGNIHLIFTKNQLRRSLAKAGITTEKQINYSQALSFFKSYRLFKG